MKMNGAKRRAASGERDDAENDSLSLVDEVAIRRKHRIDHLLKWNVYMHIDSIGTSHLRSNPLFAKQPHTARSYELASIPFLLVVFCCACRSQSGSFAKLPFAPCPCTGLSSIPLSHHISIEILYRCHILQAFIYISCL